ncbi:type 4a pilus biogenesis protein PilO [Psychromonas algicola]|uniref:type 4a pilus biogenesis protein PilO n=1 Tax=Psychromonas algicola TaxID=2555642 RepID=UPI001068AEFA|nr:type 4a pilus biogenesis protein PilO [Psychromonas sp. RZ5]TEW52720.1 pilus assembly protein PilP [Psychromonas sp. RZ5]
MNIVDLDFENVGHWPKAYQAIPILLAAMVLSVLFYYFVIDAQLEQLTSVEFKEERLKSEFIVKAKSAAHLTLYQKHLKETQKILEGFVHKLPNKKELASLLDDISFIGSHNGLQFKSINWGVKKQNSLSEEVPISIKVIGTYAQLGQFSAEIAALSRILVLEDLRIKPTGENELLMLDVVAKTYRYKDAK